MANPSLASGSNPNTNVSIGVHISSLEINVSRSHYPSHATTVPSLSQSFSVPINDASSIVSPLLAFVKAFRLRDKPTNLKQVVAAHFDISFLISGVTTIEAQEAVAS